MKLIVIAIKDEELKNSSPAALLRAALKEIKRPQVQGKLFTDEENMQAFKSPESPPKKRPRDLLWEAVLQACGLEGAIPTDSERLAWNGAVSSLSKAGATPAEVRARALIFREKWPDSSLTPSALDRRWNEVVAR